MSDKNDQDAVEATPPEIYLGPRRAPGITAAQSLAGQTLPGGWNIQAPIDRSSLSGSVLSGMNFSTCYEALGPERVPAIIKVFDFEKHMGADDPLAEVGFYTRMFEHERDMLKKTTSLTKNSQAGRQALWWRPSLWKVRRRNQGRPNSLSHIGEGRR